MIVLREGSIPIPNPPFYIGMQATCEQCGTEVEFDDLTDCRMIREGHHFTPFEQCAYYTCPKCKLVRLVYERVQATPDNVHIDPSETLP
jgi:hypothetical protein